MRPILLCVAACAAAVSAFQMPMPALRRPSRVAVRMAGSAYVSTKAGKAERLTKYKELLDNADVIFCVPGYGLSTAQLSTLRRKVPETTKVNMAKNTLLRVAIAEDERWTPVTPSLEGQNLWFFVKQDDMKPTFDAYADFLKANKPLQESHKFRFGSMDSQYLDADGVEKLSKMPGKLELYTRLAVALKHPGTQLARTLKAAPTKLTRAIKLSFLPDDDDKDEEKKEE